MEKNRQLALEFLQWFSSTFFTLIFPLKKEELNENVIWEWIEGSENEWKREWLERIGEVKLSSWEERN